MSLFKKYFSLWLVLGVVFFDEMGFGLVYPLFSSMLFLPEGALFDPTTSEAIKGVYLGILLSVPALAAFFSSPILGALSDQKGRKTLYLVSLSLAICGYGICILGLWIKSIASLIFARFIVGIATGNVSVVCATVADLSTTDNKAKHFGLYSMAGGVGFMIGPFLGGFFSKISFFLPFLMAGIAVFLNLVLIFFFFKETHKVQKEARIIYQEGFQNLKKAFQLKDLKAIFILALCFCVGWSFFYEFIPITWISDYGFHVSQIGFFYAYGAGFYALSSGLLIRPFLNRYKPHSLVFYSSVFLGCVMLMIPFFPKPFLIWIYLPMINFLIALVYPTYSSIVSNSVDENSQGEILGILQSVQMFAFGLSPILGGLFLSIHPHTPLWIGSFFILLGAIPLGIFLRRKIFSS